MRYFINIHPPREWRGGKSGVEIHNGKEWVPSIFNSIDELLECIETVEVDENGNALKLTSSEIDEIRGDDECKLMRNESE